jgi:hypothetical protein
MTKLNAKNRTDLIRHAIRRGLISLDAAGDNTPSTIS